MKGPKKKSPIVKRGARLSNRGKPEMTNPPDRMTAEYHEWMRANGVDLGSADESVSLVYDIARAHLHDETMTDTQRAWLADFCRRWEREHT